MNILGISALYHDSAAALIINGEIIAAVQEERFTRRKGDPSLPVNSIKYCISCLNGEKLDYVAYYDNPFLTLDRWLNNMLNRKNIDLDNKDIEKLFANRLWIHDNVKNVLSDIGYNSVFKFVVCNHHISHASSAFYPSPFKSAAILTIDGVGEWATSSLGIGHDNKISIIKELRYPNSLGLMYSAFTSFCGFKVNFGEYKLMGLAPYGQPVWADTIMEKMLNIKEDGSFALNMEFFSFIEGGCMYSDRFSELFGVPPRKPESNIIKVYADIAASIQKVTEHIIVRMAKHLRTITNQNTLVLAGGCALNCVANGVLQRLGIFDKIWIQPASNDSGGALGAALFTYYNKSGNSRTINDRDSQKGSFLGPEYSEKYIKELLNKYPLNYCYYEVESDMYQILAEKLNKNEVIGIFYGRMEFGPRALGHRSIIASALPEEAQIKVNRKIKFRESFRPFAPSVLIEDVNKYFLLTEESPYMLLVSYVRPELCLEQHSTASFSPSEIVKQKRSVIPAVTHVDYTARIQTVDAERNSFFYNIINEYKKLTGYGVLLNTSFNVRGEPIVCSPDDALRCFFKTEMDTLVLGNFIIDKEHSSNYD